MRNFWDFHDRDYRILYVLKDLTGKYLNGEEFFEEVWASELGPQGSMSFQEDYSYRYATEEEEAEYRRSLGQIVPVPVQ